MFFFNIKSSYLTHYFTGLLKQGFRSKMLYVKNTCPTTVFPNVGPTLHTGVFLDNGFGTLSLAKNLVKITFGFYFIIKLFHKTAIRKFMEGSNLWVRDCSQGQRPGRCSCSERRSLSWYTLFQNQFQRYLSKNAELRR